MIRENNHRAHPLGVIQVKKDSSNKNNADRGRKEKLVMGPLQPPFELRKSKWCSVSSLTIIEY